MARTLSSAALSGIYARETSEIYHTLLTIDHADLASPIRVVDNNEDVVSNSNTFTAFPFIISLPPSKDNEIPRVTLTIDNVDRQIVTAIRSVTSELDVTMQIVLASSPDTVEAGPFNFTLQDVEYTAETVSGTLGFERILDESFPAGTFNPAQFPAVAIV